MSVMKILGLRAKLKKRSEAVYRYDDNQRDTARNTLISRNSWFFPSPVGAWRLPA
jgi:hypothetical protein